MKLPHHGYAFFYIWDGKDKVTKVDIREWSNWFHNDPIENKVLKADMIHYENDDILISTVFLGIDLNINNKYPSIWETSIFVRDICQYTKKYSTIDEALEGHKEAVELAKTFDPRND